MLGPFMGAAVCGLAAGAELLGAGGRVLVPGLLERFVRRRMRRRALGPGGP